MTILSTFLRVHCPLIFSWELGNSLTITIQISSLNAWVLEEGLHGCLHVQLAFFSSSGHSSWKHDLALPGAPICPFHLEKLLKLSSRFPLSVASVLCAGICSQVVSSHIKAFPQSFHFCHMSQAIFTPVQCLEGHYFFIVCLSSGRTGISPFSAFSRNSSLSLSVE